MSEGYLCKESFYNNSGADAWTSPIFQSSGPVEFTCVRRFFFFFGEKEKKQEGNKQEGRRTPDLRLSGSQIRRQDALTEKAWEDQRPHRDSILLEVLCQDSLSSPPTQERGLLPV